jgi:DNA-binding PadR family transcriptional regulator
MVKAPLSLELALLGILRRRPMHAYEMHHQLAQANALGLIWRLKQSQLYALLGRLEEEGYIAGVTEPQGIRPPRKVLHLTPAGEAAFLHWLITPVAHGRDFRQEFLAKLFFAHQEGPDYVQSLLEQQRTTCQAMLAEMQAKASTREANNPYAWLVYEFRVSQLSAILTWLDTCHMTLTPPLDMPEQ